MKFIINSQTLLKKLQLFNGVISSNNNLPILDDFLFTLEDNVLKIVATDLETTLIVDVAPSMSSEDGKVTIPSKLLLDFLKNLPDTPITFNINDATCAIEILSSEGKYKLAGRNAELYPELLTMADTTRFSLHSEILSSGIVKTIFATGNDELRPVMNGVYFDIMPEYIIFVATDAHKLVRYRRNDAQTGESASFIIPKKPLNVLKNLLSTEDVMVNVEYNVTNVSFEYEGVKLYSRLIEGAYPAYESVIPKDNPNKLIVDRVLLMSAIKRLSPFANQSTHQLRLRIAGQVLHLSAEDIDYSNEGSERLNVNYAGEDMEIGFNGRFLLEMVTNMDTEDIVLNLSNPARAGILLPHNLDATNEDVLMLVMPVMLGQS